MAATVKYGQRTVVLPDEEVCPAVVGRTLLLEVGSQVSVKARDAHKVALNHAHSNSPHRTSHGSGQRALFPRKPSKRGKDAFLTLTWFIVEHVGLSCNFPGFRAGNYICEGDYDFGVAPEKKSLNLTSDGLSDTRRVRHRVPLRIRLQQPLPSLERPSPCCP